MAPTSAVLKYAALADPRRPDPRRARFSRRLVVLHLALVRARRRSILHAAPGARRSRADRLERHMAAARHRNFRQARAEWRPPRLYRVRARLPGRRPLYRRCRRPARLCEGRRALCARPARRHLARQHTGGWHAAGGSGADAGLYGGAGRYGLGRARAQPPRLADAALPSQLHDRLRAVLAAQPLLPLVVGQGVRRAARHFVAPAAGLRCCERLDLRQAHRFDPHRDPHGIRPAPNMGRDRQMTAFDTPTVATGRLRLRAFHAADLDAYSAMQANPNVMRYLLIGQTATRVQVWYTMLTAAGSWALRGYGMWAVEEVAGGRFIGSVGIFEPLDWPEPEIAYSLDEPYWHQGFATEAAAAARDWLFAHLPHQRLASFIRPENGASIRRRAPRRGSRGHGRVARRHLPALGPPPPRKDTRGVEWR